MIRRRVRVGARAARRIRAGGPTSVHRQALESSAWRALVAYCRARERGRCFHCRDPRCLPLDPHHVVKRSAGGDDSVDNIVTLGRPCHDWTDAPYSGRRGRLVIRALGRERFVAAVVQAPSKWAGIEKAQELLAMAERALVEA